MDAHEIEILKEEVYQQILTQIFAIIDRLDCIDEDTKEKVKKRLCKTFYLDL